MATRSCLLHKRSWGLRQLPAGWGLRVKWCFSSATPLSARFSRHYYCCCPSVAHIVASGATKRRGCVRNKRAPEEPPESRKVGDGGTSGSLEDEMCPLTAHLSPMAQDSLPRPLVLRGWRSGERAAEGQRPGEGPGTLTLSRKPSRTARQP